MRVPLDVGVMRQIAEELYAARVEREYGEAGTLMLARLMAAIERLFTAVPYERFQKGVMVVAPAREVAERAPLANTGVELDDAELGQRLRDGCSLLLTVGGRFALLSLSFDAAEQLATTSLVYKFEGGDYLYLSGGFKPIPNPTGLPSVFGQPTFLELEDCISFYARSLARQSTCRILRECWFDMARVVLVNKPESIMRKSLAQHLRSSLRGHGLVEVREEQNVDESHPIDIKVTWTLSNRLALVEIKWLGASVNVAGTAISTTYEEGRAREGAHQLAGYLNANLIRAPVHVTQGYLVVFDARRQGASVGANLTWEQLTYFADREVAYDPRYENLREDFAPPIRLFLEAARPTA